MNVNLGTQSLNRGFLLRFLNHGCGFSSSRLLGGGPANVFYLPKLKAGETVTVALTNKGSKEKAFHWQAIRSSFAAETRVTVSQPGPISVNSSSMG